MSELIWILDSSKGASFGSSGVSSSYILPESEVTLELGSCAGRRLWVVLRGYEDSLLLLLHINKIERIIEGYHHGDYWVSPDIVSSIKLSSASVVGSRYITDSARDYGLGVSNLKEETSGILVKLIQSSIQVKLVPPDKNTLSKIKFEIIPSGERHLAQSAMRAVISHLTLDRIWASGSGDRLGAFPNFASSLLTQSLGQKPTPTLIEHLRSFDPVSMLLLEENHLTLCREPSYSYNGPVVDTEFSEIDPTKIYAREYVSGSLSMTDFEDAIKKTEHAEKIHQAILKDITEYLIMNGVTPYESSSIDLLYVAKETLNVLEIKSSSADNILSQSSKGAFQLACYMHELCKDYENLDGRLVLQAIKSPELEKYVVKILSRMGVEVLIYDRDKSWPERLQGLVL